MEVTEVKRIIVLKDVSSMVHFHPYLTAKLRILMFDLICDLVNVSILRVDCVKMRTSVTK
jgi:hypothetical protein